MRGCVVVLLQLGPVELPHVSSPHRTPRRVANQLLPKLQHNDTFVQSMLDPPSTLSSVLLLRPPKRVEAVALNTVFYDIDLSSFSNERH